VQALPNTSVPLAVLTLPVLSTLLGGWLTLRMRRYLPPLLAVGAGLLLGTAFLDLLPEAMSLAATAKISPGTILAATLAAFLTFLTIEGICSGIGHFRRQASTTRKALGRISGSLLILHSLRDGMVIGAAYSISHAAGVTVALGIVAHDLGDGMNTVLLSTAGEKPRRWDYAFLAADALAPFVGGLLTIWWAPSPTNAVILLVVAAGFFLQMATGELLPELRTQAAARAYWVPLVLLGVGLIYVANTLMLGL
jgi:zinc transporter ZupT